VLDQIQRHGDREAFRLAGELRQRLSRLSNARSAAS
jgi:predicted DNA-binding protein